MARALAIVIVGSMLAGLFAVPGADASGALLLPAAPTAPGTADSDMGVGTSDTSAEGTVAIPGVSAYRVQRFNVDVLRSQVARSMFASLSLAGTVWALSLKPGDLAGPDFRVTDEAGQTIPMDLSSLSSYGGTVQGVAGSSVSLTFSGDWFSLWINVDGKATIVEPLRQWDPEVGRDAYAVYTSDNARLTLGLGNDAVPIPAAEALAPAAVTDSGAVAATSYNVTAEAFPSVSEILEPRHPTSEVATPAISDAGSAGERGSLLITTDSKASDKANESRGAAQDAYFRLLRLVVTVDPQYQNAYSDWAGSVWSTVGGLNSILEPQASVHVQLQEVNVWSGSPYEFDFFQLLADYRNYMQGVATVRDYGILFSGKQLGGGASYLRGLGTSWAYSVTQHVAEGNFDASQFARTIHTTHETGHGLNGVHEQGWCDWLGTCTIMYPWNGGYYFSYFSDGQDNWVKSNRQRIIRWSWANLHRVLIVADGLPDTNTADGLQLVSFTIEADDVLQVNAYVTVGYQINNIDGFSKTFPTYGFLVGARDASGVNRDFGQTGTITLCAHCAIAIGASRSLTSGGTWEFWPAYYYDPPGPTGPRWGTYRWHVQTRNAYYVLGHLAVPSLSCTFDDTYGDACDGFIDVTAPRVTNGLLFHFYLLAFRSAPRVNDYVYVVSTFFWTGTDAPSLNYFFIVGRNPAWANKDFGYTGSWRPSPRPTWDTDATTGNNPAGGAMIDQLSRVLDSSGTWWFWPSYRRDASYFDFAGSAISISVSA